MRNGGTISNKTQKSLNLFDEFVGKPITSIFQIVAVTRPLCRLAASAMRGTMPFSTLGRRWSEVPRAMSFAGSSDTQGGFTCLS